MNSSSNPNGDPAETLAWPVLASLPRVGAQREPPRAATNLDATVAYAAERIGDAPALRIATPAEAPEEFEPLATPPAGSGTLEFRTFIDQPHLAVRGYDWPLGGEGQMAVQRAPSAALSSTHRRIDAGSPRPGASENPQGPPRTAEPLRQSLATKIFQIHAAAAPHAGMIMTLALAASVGLLCWFTMGRPDAATPHGQAPGAAGGWPAKTATAPPPEGAAGVSAAPDQFVSEFAWRATPTSTPAAAPAPATVRTDDAAPPAPPAAAAPNDVATITAPTLDLSVAPETSTATAAAAPAPAPVAPVEEAAVAQSPEPITPTPHPHAFPTTPYGAFNYFAQPATATPPSSGSAADQTPLASQPAEATAAPATNR